MQLIEHYEAPSAVSSITFSDIPQTFTDLIVMLSLRNSSDNDEIGLLLNGSSSNFSQRSLRGEGTTVLSQTRATNSLWLGATKSVYTASTFGNCQLYIPNYTSSANKSLSFDSSLENNATDGRNGINAILWSDTDAITSIQLNANANFAQYSSASLFGVLAGSDGIVSVS
jgi:hypothetical protein